MNTPKFTPGPWRHLRQFDHFANRSKSYVCYGEPDAVNPDDSTFPPDQCICGCGRSDIRENAANAALIAAAPEMYDVLAECLAYIARSPMTRNGELEAKLNIILAKARGEEQ